MTGEKGECLHKYFVIFRPGPLPAADDHPFPYTVVKLHQCNLTKCSISGHDQLFTKEGVGQQTAQNNNSLTNRLTDKDVMCLTVLLSAVSCMQVRQLLAGVSLSLLEKKQLFLLTLGTVKKLVYAFLWQEQTFRHLIYKMSSLNSSTENYWFTSNLVQCM
jgi:hypothetical protein